VKTNHFPCSKPGILNPDALFRLRTSNVEHSSAFGFRPSVFKSLPVALALALLLPAGFGRALAASGWEPVGLSVAADQN
jgi:hypothetical protein